MGGRYNVIPIFESLNKIIFKLLCEVYTHFTTTDLLTGSCKFKFLVSLLSLGSFF